MQKQIITIRDWDVLKHTLPAGFQSIEFIGGDKYRVKFTMVRSTMWTALKRSK